MAGLADILQWLKSATGNQPDAYSRTTRTPIYKNINGEGILGQYQPPIGPKGIMGGNYIRVPNANEIDPTTLAHEEAHKIFQSAGLKKYSKELAPQVSPDIRSQLDYYPKLYDKRPETIANEGLGYTMDGKGSDKWAYGYLENIYNKIEDPKLKEQFRQLMFKRGKSYKPITPYVPSGE